MTTCPSNEDVGGIVEHDVILQHLDVAYRLARWRVQHDRVAEAVGLSYDELAEVIGVSCEAAKARLSRARQALTGRLTTSLVGV